MLEAVIEISPLLERESGFAAIERTLDAAEHGRGRALFFIGEPGIGKTSMLDSAAQVALDRFRVGRGQADSLDAVIPYRLLREAFAGVEPQAPFTEAVAMPRGDARASLFYAAIRWLEEAAATSPVLLVLDDVHWADSDSLALITLLCRRLPQLSAAVVASLRPWPPAADQTARSLVTERLASIERLEALGEESALRLLRDRAGELEGELVARTWRLTAGNPLLLEQAAAIIRREGDLPGEGGGGRELLVSRFAGVGADALRLARAASILGLHFRPGVAAELAGLDEVSTDDAVGALATAGLVADEEPGRATFVHPLFRQALYDDIETPVRARLHARAFRLLRRLGVDSAEIAEQALRADLTGDLDAVAALERAGGQALRVGATAAALQHLEGAVRLAGEMATPRLRMALANAELVSGDAAAAVRHCHELLADDRLEARERVDARRVRGRARFYLGELRDASADYEASMRASRGEDPDIAAEVGLEHATVVFFGAGPGPALALMAEARGIAPAAAAPVQAAADLGWALVSVLTGHADGLDAAAEGARVLIRGSHIDRAGSLAFFANAAAALERFQEADSAFATALEWAEQMADPVIMSLVAASWAATMLRRGVLNEAIELSRRALAVVDLAPGARTMTEAVAALAMLERGDRPRSQALAASAEAMAAARGEWIPSLWLRIGQLRRNLDDAHPGDAASDAAWLMATAEQRGLTEPCFVPWARDAVTALVGAGELDGAQTLISRLAAVAATLPCAWPRAVVALGQAMLAERAGDMEASERGHTAAQMLLAGAGLELDRARSLAEAGAMLRRAGQPARARPLLAEALAIAEAAGAGRLAVATAAELQAAGGRRRRRSGGSELTAAEERVARLAVEGLSNIEIAAQLFVSAKTVDTHLQHIYQKLGINSRRELMRRGIRGPDEVG